MLLVVRELGFANVALGAVGCLILIAQAWVTAAATAGVLFYAPAGANPLFKKERNVLENGALTSDAAAAALLSAFLVATLTPWHLLESAAA